VRSAKAPSCSKTSRIRREKAIRRQEQHMGRSTGYWDEYKIEVKNCGIYVNTYMGSIFHILDIRLLHPLSLYEDKKGETESKIPCKSLILNISSSNFTFGISIA
jgi:hypothetical protein